MGRTVSQKRSIDIKKAIDETAIQFGYRRKKIEKLEPMPWVRDMIAATTMTMTKTAMAPALTRLDAPGESGRKAPFLTFLVVAMLLRPASAIFCYHGTNDNFTLDHGTMIGSGSSVSGWLCRAAGISVDRDCILTVLYISNQKWMNFCSEKTLGEFLL